MAKKLVTSYTFTPGVSGVGKVVIAGTYALEQFLLITNVVDNIIIYEFDLNALGGTVATGGGNTTLTLTYDTSAMSSSDGLQIFIDDGQNPTVSVSGTTAISATTLPLPTGASTAAKQPALGTAGTPSADVLTVQGATSMTALKVDGSAVTQPVSGSVTVSGTVTASGPLTDTQLRATAVPVSGTITANAGTNLNTSSLALESGGNLASINTKLPALALGAQAPTAALATVGANKAVVTFAAATPALNLDLLTNTTNGWLDVSNYNYASFTIITGAGITAGAVTFEQTNDNTISNAAPALSIVVSAFSAPSPNVLSPAANSNYQVNAAIQSRYIRVRVSTAFSGGTVSLVATLGQGPILTSGVNSSSVNLAQLGGSTPFTGVAGNGNANVALAVTSSSGISAQDYSAQSVAAASGSLGTAAGGPSLGTYTFDINLTAFTAGSSTGLDLYYQESPDNGTTWYDIWQCEALTAVGRVRIPQIPLAGRRRIRWVNRGGAATTATLTVNYMASAVACPKQVQFFDRTSGVGSGTAVLNTNSAIYDIAGCRYVSIMLQQGTATSVASFQAQVSSDGLNWMNASPVVTINSTSAGTTPLPVFRGFVGRYIRVTCTNAGSSQTMNAIQIYGTN
jgi:hypothetical protein